MNKVYLARQNKCIVMTLESAVIDVTIDFGQPILDLQGGIHTANSLLLMVLAVAYSSIF